MELKSPAGPAGHPDAEPAGRDRGTPLPGSRDPAPAGTGHDRHDAVQFAVLIGGLVLLWLSGRLFSLDLASMEGFFRDVPLAVAGPAFVVAYVVVTFVIWFSKDLFRIAGALVFGPYWSTLFLCVGELINACILFRLSRRLGRAWVDRRVSDKHRTLDERLKKLGFSWLLLFRATPLIPYRFLDLAAGLTAMSFRRYFAACLLGTPPRVFWLQFILATVGRTILTDPASVGAYLEQNAGAYHATCGYVVLIVVVALRMRRDH